jgi:uncharacterized repeat protein (TIGR01451 family)
VARGDIQRDEEDLTVEGLRSNFRRRAKLPVLAAMALLGLLLAMLVPSALGRTESFQSLAPSTVPLTAFAADPGTGLMYAQQNNGNSFFRYDAHTNTWTELAPAPLPSGNNGGATFLNGKIYVSYTSNSSEISVYDIASNSWTTMKNPLELGTGNITSGNGKLYMAVDLKFVSFDPATGITTPLADAPKFDPAECHEGFENWGGLQFDGDKIYGHQGDACRGFAVYDIATNSWQELPLVPEVEEHGAVLGSALDPITNTYLTYGPYGGETLFRYDIEAGTWTTGTVPFEVEDGGMAYVGLPGIEGVYMIQGESDIGFTRYTERNTTDLSVAKSGQVKSSATSGTITYSIQVKNSGFERAGGVTLTDPLPAGSKLVSATASQGSCAGTTTIVCSLGVLKSGATASLTVKVTASFGKGKMTVKQVTNTATVTSQAVDANAANDSASAVSKLTRCVVPKLKGLSLKKAKKALRKAHCAPGKVSKRYSSKFKTGRVVRGGKRRGTALKAGSKVKLTVSRGPKPKATH